MYFDAALVLDFPDFILQLIFRDQIPVVGSEFGLQLFGDSFGTTQHYPHATAELVTKDSIKIDKMIDMGMADKNGCEIQTILFAQEAGAATFTQVVLGMVVDAQMDTNVFSWQVF